MDTPVAQPAFQDMSGDGTHESAIEVAEHLLERAQLLVCGAGQGALEWRLIQRGVPASSISALELHPERYLLSEVDVLLCDLNGAIPFEATTFDLCFATEVADSTACRATIPRDAGPGFHGMPGHRSTPSRAG